MREKTSDSLSSQDNRSKMAFTETLAVVESEKILPFTATSSCARPELAKKLKDQGFVRRKEYAYRLVHLLHIESILPRSHCRPCGPLDQLQEVNPHMIETMQLISLMHVLA